LTVFRDNLEFYKDKINKAIITNCDYETIVKKYDSDDTFFFIDPPYEDTDNRFYLGGKFDYEHLHEVLKNIKGDFLITINDSPYIRDLFKDFRIKSIDVMSGWRHKGTNKRKELFIMNYKFR